MMQLAEDIQIAPEGGFRGFGIFGLEGSVSADSSGALFNLFISRAIGVITIVAFVWFIFLFFSGAIGIMTAGGDKQSMESAKKRITNGLIGLIAVIAGIFVVSLLGQFLGIENVLNPGEAVREITK